MVFVIAFVFSFLAFFAFVVPDGRIDYAALARGRSSLILL
jgi:hypothetical protein